jgi:hypothetical protein
MSFFKNVSVAARLEKMSLRIFPRSRQDGGRLSPSVVLSIDNLKELFSFSLDEAARRLGLCPTSLKWYEICPTPFVENMGESQHYPINSFYQRLQKDWYRALALSTGTLNNAVAR